MLACWLAVTAQVIFVRGTEAAVVRGPYLQQGTPSQIIVQWRTDNGSGSFVRYGTHQGALADIVGDPAIVTNHIVLITNLQPATKYFYEIGTATNWFAGTTNHYFITAPPVGPSRPTRIWALGDSGEPGPEAASVRDAYAAFAGDRPTDVWLMLGDNAYGDGEDGEYQAAVFNFYPQFLRNTVLWPTLGNHDRDPVYFSIFSLPQNAEAGGVPSGSERYYSFDYANIHFICLDSSDSDRTTNGPMYAWMRADLEATTQKWLIAYWHHPPYSKGTHDSDEEEELIEMRLNYVPILESFGVDLVLNGHSHNYERSYLLDGHYGLSTTLAQSMKKNGGSGRENGDGAYTKLGGPGNQGAVYTVAGCSAMSSEPDPMPAMFVSLDFVGSVVIDVDGGRLDFKFLQGNGALGDYFTLIKAPITPPEPPAAPTNLTALAADTNRIELYWADASTNETGFRIERSENGVNFALIATVGANVTSGADLDLAPDTAFDYRVRAYNAAGDSPHSNVAQARTHPILPPEPDATPPGTITNLTPTGVTSNTVTLFWFAPGDDGHVGRAARYELRRATNLLTESLWDSAVSVPGLPAPAVAGQLQGFTVAGLEQDTPYWFGVKTSDESTNLSALSRVAVQRTLRADGRKSAGSSKAGAVEVIIGPALLELPDAPSGLTATSLASNTVRLAWIDQSDNEVFFAIARSTDGENFSRLLQVGANVTNALDQSALPDTRYYYYVTAGHAGGESDPSAVVQTLTPPTAPPDVTPPAAVTNLRRTSANTSSITLAWSAPGDDGNTGRAAVYDLRRNGTPITAANWSNVTAIAGLPLPSTAGASETFTVTGLVAGTTHYFALRTRDEAGNESPLSNIPSAATTGPPAPWQEADIGATGLGGSATFASGVFTVRGAGTDIGSTNDAFHFVFQPAEGDCEIIARVTSVDDTSSSAKAGVMIRDSLLPGAKLAMLALTPGDRILWLRRTANNGNVATTTATGTFSPPQWLRITRTNNLFNASFSANGSNWTAAEPKTINLGTNIFIGLAVTSRDTNELNTATFDNAQAAP